MESTVDKNKCPKGNEMKTCSKCGFTGTKYPNFKRSLTPPWGYQYALCKPCTHKAHKAWKYKLTVEELDELLDVDNCTICERSFKEAGRKVIDHCHETGEIRDVLCDPCNTTLGQLEKTPDILNQYINYINQHKPLI
tara:strand:- start:973 stop:1383 length:411 start_codon:yes stop_codon:yes gene_type:complete